MQYRVIVISYVLVLQAVILRCQAANFRRGFCWWNPDLSQRFLKSAEYVHHFHRFWYFLDNFTKKLKVKSVCTVYVAYLDYFTITRTITIKVHYTEFLFIKNICKITVRFKVCWEKNKLYTTKYSKHLI